ncbi:MAG TPA: SEC-C metal-binding domain-containing protein [Bryobacteraceae bacterium]|nr:SEC-C metal-binding domain-containing protein [Bryobacteraceae bacterium]
MPHPNLIFEPGRYEGVPAYSLLQSAGHGYIAVDQRLLRAILDRPEQSLPDIVRFAAEEHADDLMDLDPLLIDLFHSIRTPEALPFFVRVIRKDPTDVPDDLVEALVELGPSSVEPLLQLLAEFEHQDAGDIPFILAALHVRDPRVLEALTKRLEFDPQDAALCLETYGDAAAIPAIEAALAKIPADDQGARAPLEAVIRTLSAPGEVDALEDKPFDIWPLYPKEAAPDFHALEDADLLAMLDRGSAQIRSDVALSFQGGELSDEVRARLIGLAKSDPDAKVRGASWEALGEIGEEPELHKAMLKVLADPKAAIEERAGVAIGLAEQSDNAAVYQAILNLYQEPGGRAKSLKAMARSFDKRFSGYPPKHLDDPDAEIKRQAVWGIGYLNVSSEAPRLVELFDDEEFRTDALFAYALAVPGETSSGRIRALMTKVEKAAGGFREDEEDLIRIALDQRLMMHGKDPVFFPDEDEVEEADHDHVLAPAPAPGRNDLCSCGSGKKYKKCHGLVN